VTGTPQPTSTPSLTPTLTPTPRRDLPDAFVFGKSVEGRDLYARRFGKGDKVIFLVGGVHTGYEANTVTLVNELIDHFAATPGDVLPGVMLVLIPAVNPDGLTRGRDATGRFNANGVDLNRNWNCEWSSQAVWQQHQVDPGPHPFSEPETQALGALILDVRPSVVLFYHSAARGVFAGDCNGSSVSDTLAEVLGKATGYPYGEAFSKYVVTGTESNWVDAQGIPSADVELATTTDDEFIRNLYGVMAVQCWLTGKVC
jgi:predicted deacylase